MGTTHERFHPYGAVGLGAAFNKFSNFVATTTQTGPVNVAPMYSDTSTTSFSYTVGLGVETDLYKHLRLGLGYRFSSFGKADFGYGTVTVNNFTATTPFNFVTPNAFANQFVAQLSFVA